MKKRPPKPELRTHPMRRQLNEAFCDPSGAFSVGKFMAVWSQIAVLSHMNIWFEKLVDKPESLFIVLAFLIAPNLVSKWLTLKLGAK